MIGRPKSTLKSFEQKSFEQYGDQFDLSLFKYVDRDTPGTIFCRKHKKYYNLSMRSHLRNLKGGNICKGCLNDHNLNILSKIFERNVKSGRELHKDEEGNPKYTYLYFIYVNAKTKSLITCPLHGNFICTMNNHTNGVGCPECSLENQSKRFRFSIERNIKDCEKIHGPIFDFSDFGECKNRHSRGNVICGIEGHAPWNTTFNQLIAMQLGCPACGLNRTNKTEKKLKKILEQNFNYQIIHDRGFEWCKKEKKLRYDFIIEELKCIIELDGRQHFVQVRDWKSPEEQLKDDTLKNNKAMENGYSVIRVLQEDIFKNKPDIILKLILSIQRYRIPQLICIGEIYRGRFNIENLTLLI